MAKFMIYGAVYVFLKKDGQVYLMRRANTGYRDGLYSLPAGHLEEGETLIDAARREVREETGVVIPDHGLRLAHAMYRRSDDRTYADYFFTCETWDGEPSITEEDKCDGAVWVGGEDLPEDTVAEVRHAWACIRRGETFSDINA